MMERTEENEKKELIYRYFLISRQTELENPFKKLQLRTIRMKLAERGMTVLQPVL